jgi:hypothetical protein
MIPEFVRTCQHLRPHPEERALARVSKDGSGHGRASGHPSRRPQSGLLRMRSGVCCDLKVEATGETRGPPPPTEVGPARLRSLDIVAEPSQQRGSAGGRSAAAKSDVSDFAHSKVPKSAKADFGERPGGGDGRSTMLARPQSPTPDRLRRSDPPPAGDGVGL